MARSRPPARDSEQWDYPADYARHRGVTRQAVHKAIAEGRIQLIQGRINRAIADREWAENSAPRSSPPAAEAANDSAGAGITLAQARAAWQTFRARLAQLEFEEKSGRLVDAGAVKQAAFEQGRRTREKILAVPARVAPVLAAARTRAECARILTAELRRVLEELGLEAPSASANAS